MQKLRNNMQLFNLQKTIHKVSSTQEKFDLDSERATRRELQTQIRNKKRALIENKNLEKR